jgi:hypothetical protein
MFKSVRITLSVVALSCLAVAGCAQSNTDRQHRGVEVTIVNSNQSDVMVYGSPGGKPGKVEGCRNPSCPEPKSGEDPSGAYFGWTETRQLPRQYRLVLTRTNEPLNCPPTTGRPTSSIASSTPYAVVYDITPSGRCVIASHVPLS